MTTPIRNDDLVIHFLNVGFGDNIIVELPVDGNGIRKYGLVDCRNGSKTLNYLNKLTANNPQKLAFLCATHPHSDHISGITKVMNSAYCPEEFWESGFRHSSLMYQKILNKVIEKNIQMTRVTSGMEWYFGKVRITALAPSLLLRNRYATYGVDVNNASIVLRIEHFQRNTIALQSKEYTGKESSDTVREAGKSVAILAGDAEFDSWAHIVQEFPKLERTSEHHPLVKKMVNYLSCSVIKIAHHGSMHSTPLDVYEKILPKLAIISTKQAQSTKNLLHGPTTRDMFPHKSAQIALEESKTRILTTDGSYENQYDGNGRQLDTLNAHEGSVVVVIPPGKKPLYRKLDDGSGITPTPPATVIRTSE